MKNIAILCPRLYGGGAERIAGLLSKKFSEHHRVYVFLLDTTNIVYEYGGTIVDIGTSLPWVEQAILRNKQKYHIDVSISFMEDMNLYNIKTRGREKVIISERCSQSQFDPRHCADDLIIENFYDYADEIVACSYGVAYDLAVNYKVEKKIHTIYNFIDSDTIKAKAELPFADEVSEFLNGSEYFINVGRLDVQKNQDELIRQFAVFTQSTDRDIKLLIFGDGERLQMLNEQIAHLFLEDKIRIFRYDTNPFRYVKHAKALVLASGYEGLPNVILEAMQLGCPVISTDCLAGPRELLADETSYDDSVSTVAVCKRGLLVPRLHAAVPETENHLSKAMAMICDESLSLPMIHNQLEYMSQYSNDMIYQKWLELVEGEINQRCAEVPNEYELLDQAECIILYGAGNVAKSYYLELSKNYKIDCVAVSAPEGNEHHLHGIPVVPIRELTCLADRAVIVLGVHKFRNEIVELLKELNFTKIIQLLY